jgi:CubicO group peptidase (beta-lactamase class C family)
MPAFPSPLALACVFGVSLSGWADSPPTGQAADTVVTGELGAKLDDYFRRLANFGFSGAVLVANDKVIVLAKGYGLADRERKLPCTPDTVFSIGSITKQFTAAAILKLEMEGRLSVGDPMGKHLPNVPEDKAPITIHHLLTHSAGLDSDFGPSDFEEVSRGELIRRSLASKLRSKPGERFHYANAGYSLLGAIVEMVSGQGYEAYLHDHLFKPAGMTETGYRIPDWNKDRLAQGYARGGKRWGTILERPWAEDGPYWNLRANGAIHSTLGDMYRWHRALQGEAVLSKEATRKLFARHIPEGEGGLFYGYGWSIRTTRRGTNLISHNGGNGIFAADFLRYVDDGVCVFIVSNNAEAPAIRISGWIDRVLFGGSYPIPPKVVKLDSALLPKYAGTYRLPSGSKLITRAKDEALTMTAEGKEGFALLLSGTAGQADQLKALSERTATIVAAQLKRDYGPVHKAFGGRLPLDRVTAMETRNREALEEDHGAWQSFEILGSAPTGDGIETYVRLTCQRSPATVCFRWEGQHLRGLRMVEALPASRTFLPESEMDFASFSFASPANMHVRFLIKDGVVTGLTVHADGGEVVAKKIEE